MPARDLVNDIEAETVAFGKETLVIRVVGGANEVDAKTLEDASVFLLEGRSGRGPDIREGLVAVEAEQFAFLALFKEPLFREVTVLEAEEDFLLVAWGRGD